MTFSLLGWLAHSTNTLLIEVALFFLRMAFLVKGRKANWHRINKQG